METYKDVKLIRKDYKVIIKLEQILQQSFYHYDFINDPDGYTATRFYSKNGKVVHLSLEGCDIDYFPTEILELDKLEILIIDILNTRRNPKKLFTFY